MVEIFQPQDVLDVSPISVQRYLLTRFTEIGYTLNPRSEGYFIYVDDFTELTQTQSLSHITLPSLENGLFSSVEDITIKGDIVEVSLLFNNEFLLSLIFYKIDDEDLAHIRGKEPKNTFSYPHPVESLYSLPAYTLGMSFDNLEWCWG